MSAVGDLIRHYLETHPGVKKKDIAAAAGVSAQSVSGWLNGSKRPNLKDNSIIGLAEVLRVPVRVVVLANAEDRGLKVQEGADLPPDVRVAITSLQGLSPENVRMVSQLAASLAEDEVRRKRRRS